MVSCCYIHALDVHRFFFIILAGKKEHISASFSLLSAVAIAVITILISVAVFVVVIASIVVC
jgi:hypothetical protein